MSEQTSNNNSGITLWWKHCIHSCRESKHPQFFICNQSFPPPATEDLPRLPPLNCPSELLCTEEEVFEMLCALDTSKASGSDSVSGIMLKSQLILSHCPSTIHSQEIVNCCTTFSCTQWHQCNILVTVLKFVQSFSIFAKP